MPEWLTRPNMQNATSNLPAVLVSYYYFRQWQQIKNQVSFRFWVLDSGAFSAHNSGAVIKLPDFIRLCQMLKATDTTLREVYSLDVIGDWRASESNCRAMWRAGIEAIPCYHHGEPWDVLLGLARDYPKIALGGAVGLGHAKTTWAKQCFDKVWPAKIHGFGFGSEKALSQFPFHSVDATNWFMSPAHQRWGAYGKMTVKTGPVKDLRAQVRYYLRLEHQARGRWAAKMAELGEANYQAPNYYLSIGGTIETALQTLGKDKAL